jgi:[ribosomal protein S18]-alanine N-acetyltransferase
MACLSPIETVHIRPMQPADIEAVHAIDQASFPTPWPVGSYLYEVNENTASLCLVAEIALEDNAREVVGMAVAWMILDEAHIATIAVHPHYRRQGIGCQLLTDLLEEAIGRGATTATLEVRAGNVAAQALYRDFGFDIVGRRPAYYKDNSEDAILMSVFDLDQDYLDWLTDDFDQVETREQE